MRLSRFLPALATDKRGVTAVEFAMITPALCLTLLALTDLGYRSYVESIMQGALHEAARMATIGDKTGGAIDAHVNTRLLAFSSNATIDIEKSSYAEFSGFRKPEKIIQDTAPVGEYNQGDCFEDASGNGVYDLDRGRGGLGGPEDVVHYRVTMEFPRIVPLGGMLGLPDTQTISTSTLLRNQPFAERSRSPIIC